MDKLTNSTESIPIHSTYLAKDYGRIYIDKIVSLHGVSLSIISDSGAQFTSRFWRSFQRGLGTQVKLSTPSDQADWTIKTLEDMLRAYIIDFRGYWDEHWPLVE